MHTSLYALEHLATYTVGVQLNPRFCWNSWEDLKPMEEKKDGDENTDNKNNQLTEHWLCQAWY